MFTGIIETIGKVKSIITDSGNKIFWIESSISNQLKIDQSVAHNGVCLTVDDLKDGMHRVTAIEETLVKTNLQQWQQEGIVNIERCLQLNDRLDGHIVQGHVDTTATCTSIVDKLGSKEYTFKINEQFINLIIEKGSITLNGISLTIFNVSLNKFTVAIIPYTFNNTNIKQLALNDKVNIEFDIIGKYVSRISKLSKS